MRCGLWCRYLANKRVSLLSGRSEKTSGRSEKNLRQMSPAACRRTPAGCPNFSAACPEKIFSDIVPIHGVFGPCLKKYVQGRLPEFAGRLPKIFGGMWCSPAHLCGAGSPARVLNTRPTIPGGGQVPDTPDNRVVYGVDVLPPVASLASESRGAARWSPLWNGHASPLFGTNLDTCPRWY